MGQRSRLSLQWAEGDRDAAYEKALLDVTELLREAEYDGANIAQEVRLGQLVGTMRLYDD
jgi:hypothetical protein